MLDDFTRAEWQGQAMSRLLNQQSKAIVNIGDNLRAIESWVLSRQKMLYKEGPDLADLAKTLQADQILKDLLEYLENT